MNCIFCKIGRGEIPSEKVYEDEDVFIIKDIDPKAEKHYLMIPKHHYKLISDMTDATAKDGITMLPPRAIPILSTEIRCASLASAVDS